MGEGGMASYAPAGGVLLVIGGAAVVVTHDVVLMILAAVLVALTYAFAVALRRSRYSPEGQGM